MNTVTIPLFDIEPVKVRSPRRVPRAKPSISFTRYKAVNPHRCDDCMALYVEGRRPPGLAAAARWRMRMDGTVRLLCPAHMQVWKQRRDRTKR